MRVSCLSTINEAKEIVIPYKKSNQYHKLIGLAQANNREFIKAFEC